MAGKLYHFPILTNGRFIMRKFVVLTLVASFAMQSNVILASDSETIGIVSRLVMKFDELKHYAAACKDSSVNIAAIEQKVNQQILNKTGMTFKELHQQMLDDSADFEMVIQDLKAQPCPEGFSSSDLQMAESSLQTTLERLTEAEVLSSVQQSQEEPEQAVKVSETKAQDQAYQNANAVVLGQLIAYEQIPARYRNTFVPESAKARYVYYLEKGWKGIAPRYAIAAEYAFGTNSSIPSDEMLNTKFLFYVNKDNVITEVVPVKDAKKLLKRLGEPHWYWAGGDLIRNKK
jgi:hypothetical protein